VNLAEDSVVDSDVDAAVEVVAADEDAVVDVERMETRSGSQQPSSDVW
jgi:hypothetical protein